MAMTLWIYDREKKRYTSQSRNPKGEYMFDWVAEMCTDESGEEIGWSLTFDGLVECESLPESKNMAALLDAQLYAEVK